MLEYLFKLNNEEKFWGFWHDLVSQKKAGPHYFKTKLQIHLLILQSQSRLAHDKSFILLKDRKPIAGVFLLIENNDGNLCASVGGSPFVAPIIIDRSEEKAVFSKIDEIAKELGLAKVMFACDSLDDLDYNYLQKFGYLDISILSYIIDLRSNDFLKDCRRGHRCDIKKILNDPNFEVFYIDRENPNYQVHEEYRMMHRKCSGKITRPKETFDLQFENIKNGNAVLFGLKFRGRNAAFNYFEFSFDKALYFSGADEPELAKYPLYHVPIFSAMDYLAKKGVSHIDTGQPSGPSAQFEYFPDQKQLNIALFKRGFGGYFRNYFRGVKYFSKDVFEKDLTNFKNNYIRFIN